LVATGSKPFRLASIPFDDKRLFVSEIVISGGGIISIEYTKIFCKLGADVTLIVRSGAKSSLECIGQDRDIAHHLLHVLMKDNVKIREKIDVEKISVPGDGDASQKVCLGLKKKGEDALSEITRDIFLAAIDRKPNVSGTGIDKFGVKLVQKGWSH